MNYSIKEEIRRCNRCGRFLGATSGFHKKGTVCKKCVAVYAQVNKESCDATAKRYRLNNRHRVNLRNKQWWDDNPHYLEEHKEDTAKRGKEWSLKNKDKRCAASAKRRALKLEQSPNLSTYQQHQVTLLYKVASMLGVDYHVDHIKPLVHGGLHHPKNLQLVDAKYNLNKGTKLHYNKMPQFCIKASDIIVKKEGVLFANQSL